MNEQRIKPGELVAGQYRIDRLVGSGGFAQVYRAVQADLDRTVAVKILRPSSDQTETSPSKRAVDRFEREAKLVSSLQNPHTVTVYDYGTLPGGRLYMVLEYVDGTTLSELVEREGPLPVDRLIPILVQILDSLREAHALDIVHRDIKPGNIMVFDRIGHRDSVKVLDFGVAKSVAREQSAASERPERRELTAHGAVIGTPKYMSPEQLMGKPLRPASDLFSVGILAYLMYAANLPYRSNDSGSILRRMKAFEHDLGALDDAPDLLRSVGRKLLAPEVEQRYQSADEALDDLEQRDEIEMETQQSSSVDSTASATFPMGLDPEGQTASTELTSVDSHKGSEVSRIFVGEAGSEIRDEESESEGGRVARERSVAERPPERAEPTRDDERKARPWAAFLGGGVLAVGALLVYYIGVSGPAEPEEMAEPSERSEPRARGVAPSASGGDETAERSTEGAIRSGREHVGDALAFGAKAARKAASPEEVRRGAGARGGGDSTREDSKREGSEAEAGSEREDGVEASHRGSGRSEETDRTGGDDRGEAIGEPSREEGASAAEPLDRADERGESEPVKEREDEREDVEEKGAEEKEREERELEVEAWE